jgi:selenocysteine-specific elongation factor
MKQIILGTAGHIDHGKSALVKALTGTDPDRLKEEKRRGITIELGFAYLDLPTGQRIGIVDVPGHEKFVKNMVAGAGGIDVVALIVAADEGVMPQTREHLDICSLLGIHTGLVVLTKIDLVDDELRELAMEDIRDFTVGTFLEGAPIIAASALTGEGLPSIVSAIQELVEHVEERPSEGIFRLPTDRVFTMRGFGTIVTGTILSGRIAVGETVEILPKGSRAKVRGLQVHNEKVEQAEAGQRTAINLQGLEKSSIERGDVVARPGTIQSAQRLDVALAHLPHAATPLKDGAQIRLHTGTSLQMARILLLGRNELKPGEQGFAQILLEHPVAVLPNDRFVLRSSGFIQTTGGGTILDTHPERHKRFKGNIVKLLERLHSGDAAFTIRYHIKKSGYRGLSGNDLAAYVTLSAKDLANTLADLMSQQSIRRFGKEPERYIDGELYDVLEQDLIQAVGTYHTQNPLKDGIPKEELKSKLPPEMNAKLFTALLNHATEQQRLVQEHDKVRFPDHRVTLQGKQAELENRLESQLRSDGLSPTSPKELAVHLGASEQEIEELLALLTTKGSLSKLKQGLYFHAEPLEELKTRLISFLREHETIDAQGFKTLTGVSRKYSIPLAEYFDAMKVTIRVGDERILRGDTKS